VLAITPFDGEDEAIRIANDGDFGLAASVWTANLSRAVRVSRRLLAGTVSVNTVDALSPDVVRRGQAVRLRARSVAACTREVHGAQDDLDRVARLTTAAVTDSRAVTDMRFTLRQLEYFVATCEVGSVTEAALNIPVAQSSVSAAISQLERALGVQLFVRHHAQGVSPTPAGRQFLVHARALLRDAEQLERFASELTHELSGTLELGCLVTLAPLVTPRLCQEFRRTHPNVEIEMVEAGQQELVDALRTGRLTLAVTYDLELADDLRFEPLTELPPHALFAVDHPFAERAQISLAELAEEPLVLLDLPLSRDYFSSLFLAAGLEPRIAQRSRHPEVIRTLVGNGYGYTIINARPQNDRALDGRALRTVAITPPARAMTVGLAALAAMRPTRLSEEFAAHCRRSIAAGAIPGLGGDGR
jgi:DNA-binding transcriptional LysR family regulator